MDKVKISKRFQVTIPREIRDQLTLVPGQALLADIFEGSLRFRELRSLKSLRGAANGMIWKDIYRDREDRARFAFDAP